MTFEPASINDDMHAKLKQLEEQFQQTLGKRVALAVIATGYIIDFLTIGSLFYITSFMYVAAGVLIWQKPKTIELERHHSL